MKRTRFTNIRDESDPAKKFHFFRGDPSCDETQEDFALDVDLLAAQYAAYISYARIQELRGGRSVSPLPRRRRAGQD